MDVDWLAETLIDGDAEVDAEADWLADVDIEPVPLCEALGDCDGEEDVDGDCDGVGEHPALTVWIKTPPQRDCTVHDAPPFEERSGARGTTKLPGDTGTLTRVMLVR